MSEVWGQEGFTYREADISTGILVNGASIPVEPGASFRDTVKNATLEACLGKYRVLLNGTEIRPSEAPALFANGDKVEIMAYDVAGV